MGIYIKGFKPQDGLYVIKDGVIRKYKGNGGTVRPYELIEVKEPHGRLIDADALRESVLKWLPNDPCGVEENEYPYETDICVSMLMEIEDAPTIEPEPHWIPVSERLPEKNTEVIYSIEDIVSTGYMTDRDYYGSVTDLHWKDMECGARICPEAWMPLPSPWKGDK